MEPLGGIFAARCKKRKFRLAAPFPHSFENSHEKCVFSEKSLVINSEAESESVRPKSRRSQPEGSYSVL
ncbi:Uncharacterized protein dnm_001760 [Desulfonema magnum]|uniref:Uncharacterized protein n=1 Tax=Desulfonema magnum TaxID=45655 RepID=A0A975BF05_9BACT|nr:Uncharacterized protein dnm_001760 [Desulfonema magnum]